MNHIKKALYGLFAAAILAGCSSDPLIDEPNNDNNTNESSSDECYMTLDIQMPNGTYSSSRSQTTTDGGSTDGVEVGSDAENTVNNVLIILANRTTFSYIVSAEVKSNRLTPGKTSDSYNYLALSRVYKTNLSQFYDELPANTTPVVAVFVFCNPTAELLSTFESISYGDTSWVNKVCNVYQDASNTQNTNTGIWGEGSFLMNNAELTYRALPNSFDEWNAFDNSDQPFHLSGANVVDGYDDLPDNSIQGRGSVKVERSVARLDFKDGSANGDQVYDVLYHYHDGIIQEDEPLYSVKLLRIALVNMSNAFYYLPRVSEDGLLTGANYLLCGAEKPWGTDITGNYVVGPYASTFAGEVTSNFSNYFNYPYFDDDGSFTNNMASNSQYDTYLISQVLNGTSDNYESSDGSVSKGTYKVWRYITENVIPAGPAKQVNGVSTGIVFKTRIYGTEYAETNDFSHEAAWEEDLINNTAKCLNGEPFQLRRTDHAAIVGNPQDDPLLFYLDGQLYLTWEHIRQAAIQASCTYDESTGLITTINRSNSLYRAVFGDGPIPSYTSSDGTVRNPYYIWGTGTAQAHEFVDPQWNSNPSSEAYKLWEASADYAWYTWDEAGRPYAPEGQTAPTLEAKMREAVTAQGISIYESAIDPEFGAGYYCYYVYWNRHNDNLQNGVMGPMEFDVVRNNVYKLSVDKVNHLGHPRIPENDPNAPTPTTPDESAEIYLDVTVQITPWAVRINSIEF